MITHKQQLVFVCACLLINLLAPGKLVNAQSLSVIDIPLEAFHDQKPVELQGLMSSQTLEIPLPQTWQIGDGNWLEIRVRASPLLDAARSSMTILLNGQQISSFPLTEIPRVKRKVLIPANLFTPGNNTLTFTGSLYLPSDPTTNCQNWDDPSRWIAIDPGGLLHISFSRQAGQIDLSNFQTGFIEPLDKYLPVSERKQPLIVLPEKSTQDDLTSLSTISYELGHGSNPNAEWNPEIVRGSQLTSETVSDRNIIFIGTLPSEFSNQVSTNKDYLGLFPSPWGVGNAVLIIGDQNRRDGFTPASVLSDRNRTILFQGNIAYVDQSPLPEAEPFPNKVTLEDLGYLDRTVKGIGQQSLIYRLYIPYDIEPALVKLSLGLVHSPDLDVLNSAFTIYLNGFSVAGILPSNQAPTGEPIAVGLPAKKFRPGINFIRVAFDLHTPHSSCERALDTLWATVLNSSGLEMTYRHRTPLPSLKNFPLPFTDEPGVTYVVPDQIEQTDLVNLSRLSFLLGSAAYQASHPPQVMTATDFASHNTDSPNAILMGLPLDNPVIRSVNDLLPQPFEEDRNSLQDGYGVYLPTSSREASLGLMQIMPSPWVKEGTVLVLSGNDRQGLQWTWDLILNPALQNSFTGNLMVVGTANQSAASDSLSPAQSPQALFQQIADASNIPWIGPFLQKSGQAFALPALIAIGIALLLILGIVWILRLIATMKKSNAAARPEGDQDEAH